ncbi:anti-sigma factor family protein [Paenibacillus sp. UNC451MF]|uniref:anti-sigma factor family protein n=1 Tax=Paenibacillus sp. UNC451MF TaxID=1449063 RepID=UPI0005681394|nr:anti-sigma factor [Paenibacillus sp. UNC451MF]
MNKHHLHPDDRHLQRFLNNACSELELKKIGRHIQGCPDCRTRLRAYLEMESLLDEMPLLQAPEDIEDKVMGAIGRESREQSHRLREASARNESKRRTRWRNELVHGLVATAATYVFISSGVLGKIMSINAAQWGDDVQSKVAAVEWIVQQISMQLFS